MSTPTRTVPLARPDLGEREEEYVIEALRSGILGLGPFARRFEEAFAAFCGTRYAAAISSGTAGLHLGMRLADVRPGDEVITSPISFVASANAALFEHATPVFVDVDERTFNLDPDAFEAAITPRTKAVVPVHIFGYPCDIERIGSIAERHGITVIEDACEAVGARRGGRLVGAFGHTAVFAFYPNKQMTTGEGGMITTDSESVYAQVKSLSNQGRSDAGDWLEHDRLGYNYRLDELSAAVGLAQTERLAEMLAARDAVAQRYVRLLADVPGITLPCPNVDGDERSWFVFVIQVDPVIDRNAVMAALQARGVACKPYLPTIHLQPFYRSLGHAEGELPIAEAIARSTLALPFATRLAPDDQDFVVESVRDVIDACWR